MIIVNPKTKPPIASKVYETLSGQNMRYRPWVVRMIIMVRKTTESIAEMMKVGFLLQTQVMVLFMTNFIY